MSRIATSLRLRALDLRERDPLVPPRRMQFVGEGDFAATGDEFLGHFTQIAGLSPGERVLDVGCGIGRMARPLAGFLDPERGGAYSGFDVNPVGIGWCEARYPPHFSFARVDLHNARYNPAGSLRADDFRFPADDDAFDLVILTSVLTHLLEAEAGHYLSETRRVLAPGGRMLATFFLLDEGSRAALRDGRTAVSFEDPQGAVAIHSDEMPEDAVAYDERWVRARADVREVHRGTWRGNSSPPAASFQDLVLACA